MAEFTRFEIYMLLNMGQFNEDGLRRVVLWLPGADLSGANLVNANLYQANLREANLSGSNLNFALLYYSALLSANLRGLA